MRRGRIFFYLAFIIILALVAVFVIYQRFLQPAATTGNTTNPPVEQVKMVDVVVVTQKVSRGQVLTEDVVGTVPWPEEQVLQGMFTNKGDVISRQAKFDLDSGIPLTSGMLVDSADQLSPTGSMAALAIPRGMTAISIPISRLSSVSYAPQTGDHVNVIVTLAFVDLDTDFQTVLPNATGMVIGPGTPEKELPHLTAQSSASDGLQGRAELDPVLGQTMYVVPRGEGENPAKQRSRMATQTLLQDAVVLHMGDFPYDNSGVNTSGTTTQAQPGQDQTAVPGQETQNAVTQEKPPDVVTLIVSPQDAVTLNYLVYSGAQLTLALRAVNDDTRPETEAVTLQFLLDQYNIPVPVKLPYGMYPGNPDLTAPVLTNDLAPTPVP